jgi:hypothetical protein
MLHLWGRNAHTILCRELKEVLNKKKWGWRWTAWIWFRQEPAACCCESGNEPSDSRNCGEFLDNLMNKWFFKMDFDSWIMETAAFICVCVCVWVHARAFYIYIYIYIYITAP